MSCYHHWIIINQNVLTVCACKWTWCLLSSLNHSCVLLSQANDACKCNGWKNPNPPTAARMELQQQAASLTEACRSCGHSLGKMNAFMLVSVILCPDSFPVALLLEVFNIGVFEKPLFLSYKPWTKLWGELKHYCYLSKVFENPMKRQDCVVNGFNEAKNCNLSSIAKDNQIQNNS